MLSYRHAFHAGNHADVLKHLTVMLILEYLTQKDKGIMYLDTHAGAGSYSLTSDKSAKTGEFHQGIEALFEASSQTNSDFPAPLKRYLALISDFNKKAMSAGRELDETRNQLKFYPGSPNIAKILLRPQDKLHLYELHSADFPLLAKNFKQSRRLQLKQADGFAGLKSDLPPPTRRGLVLIDPSYETTDDYRQVINEVKEGLKRFAQGVYAVWYPQLDKIESKQLPKKWMHIKAGSHLTVSLKVKSGKEGMTGSGMLIINPPWKLKQALEQSLPALVAALGQDDSASFNISYQESS